MNKINKNDIKIGKYILDTITNSLYDKHLDIYRELMQNAMDAVHKKLDESISDYTPLIKTISNSNDNYIAVMDNGIGFTNVEDFKSKMLSIGNSTKVVGDDRGYRGVGRLSATYFSDEIVFIWNDSGIFRIIKWDTNFIKERMQDSRANDLLAEEILFKASSYHEVENPNDLIEEYSLTPGIFSKDFTTMAYIKVADSIAVSVKDELFNKKNIVKYIQETYPLNFSDSFTYKTRVSEVFGDLRPKYLYQHNIFEFLFIDGKMKEHKYEKIDKGFKVSSDADFFFYEINLEDDPSNKLIKGWFGFFNQSKKSKKDQTGILVKHKGITIGDSKYLTKFGKGALSSWVLDWFIGEIEIVDTYNIHPNSARNDFVINEKFTKLTKMLESLMMEFDKLRRANATLLNYDKKLIRAKEEGVDKKIHKLDKERISAENTIRNFRNFNILDDSSSYDIKSQIKNDSTKKVVKNSNITYKESNIAASVTKVLDWYIDKRDEVEQIKDEILNDLRKKYID